MRVERAAGGLVVRQTSRGREVLLINDIYGNVAVPKGHLEQGETWEDAAAREVFEETGIAAHITSPLGCTQYQVVRDGETILKQVRLFLMEAIDESTDPVHQKEEVQSAYFLAWDEAHALHDEKGYENWRWIFQKAHALLDWHDRDLERTWRQLPASAEFYELTAACDKAAPTIAELLDATRVELASVMGLAVEATWNVQVPCDIANEHAALVGAIEHTVLKPDASEVDIINICHEAADHNFRAVCVNPQHVGQAADLLRATAVIACTVVGFPLGATTPATLRAETLQVIKEGARDVDMVIPVGSMREGDVWTVYRHIEAVCQTAHQHPGVQVKVIVEAHFLTYDMVAKACYLAFAAGADFVKTSTGFAATGAMIADVALMRMIAGSEKGVKAAGGIRSRHDALNFLRFGASRIGTSSGVLIVRE